METKKKKEESGQKQVFIDHLALAKELLRENKFKDARTVIAKAEALPGADKGACEKFKKEVDEKSGAGGIFGGPEDMSDGKKLSPGKAPAEKSEDEQEDDSNGEEE